MPHGRKPPPPELVKDSVLVQKLALHKSEQSVEGIGAVSDLLFDNQARNLIVAGDSGAATVGDLGNTRALARFSPPSSNEVSIIPAGHKFHFLNRGSWGSPGCLYDADGRKLWTETQDTGVNDTAFGVTGKLPLREAFFVVGYNGGGGVSLLNSQGTKVWNQPDGNVWHVEVLGDRSSGPAKIIHSNAGGEITVRDENGTIVSKTRAPFYFSQFSLCSFPKRGGKEVLVASSDGFIWLINADASVVQKFPVPIDEQFADVKAIPVAFNGKHKEYFASVVSWRLWDRSVLYVHDAAGELVYAEAFPGTYPALTVVAGHDGKSETLVVGGSKKVCKYKLD